MDLKTKIAVAITAIGADRYLGQFPDYTMPGQIAMAKVAADPTDLGLRYSFELDNGDRGMVVAGVLGWMVILDSPNFFMSDNWHHTPVCYHRHNNTAMDQLAHDLFLEGMPMVAMVQVFDRDVQGNPVEKKALDSWLSTVEQGLIALKFLP